jgi:hypothetical protein
VVIIPRFESRSGRAEASISSYLQEALLTTITAASPDLSALTASITDIFNAIYAGDVQHLQNFGPGAIEEFKKACKDGAISGPICDITKPIFKRDELVIGMASISSILHLFLHDQS